uniref:Uncharacterized protein n=1 Tax=Zea mays TaxID=4577 RepID=A0A804QZ07_MAIZE
MNPCRLLHIHSASLTLPCAVEPSSPCPTSSSRPWMSCRAASSICAAIASPCSLAMRPCSSLFGKMSGLVLVVCWEDRHCDADCLILGRTTHTWCSVNSSNQIASSKSRLRVDSDMVS